MGPWLPWEMGPWETSSRAANRLFEEEQPLESMASPNGLLNACDWPEASVGGMRPRAVCMCPEQLAPISCASWLSYERLYPHPGSHPGALIMRLDMIRESHPEGGCCATAASEEHAPQDCLKSWCGEVGDVAPSQLHVAVGAVDVGDVGPSQPHAAGRAAACCLVGWSWRRGGQVCSGSTPWRATASNHASLRWCRCRCRLTSCVALLESAAVGPLECSLDWFGCITPCCGCCSQLDCH
jgi:hypothetical protein